MRRTHIVLLPVFMMASLVLVCGCVTHQTAEEQVSISNVTLAGPTPVTRGDEATYTATVAEGGPSNPTFKWKFEGGGQTIEEDTGTTNTWSGVMVVSGTIEVTVGDEYDAALPVVVNSREWSMAHPPEAEEVVAPSWDKGKDRGVVGKGRGMYIVGNEVTDGTRKVPGHVSSGPNKGFYYILEDNYFEEWKWFHWWITRGFRVPHGKFWAKTKQEQGYTDEEIADYIEKMIGHETDGTTAESLGHRKIIIETIMGNPAYDPKAAVERLVRYNSRKQIENAFTHTVNSIGKAFEEQGDTGEEHPKWGNAKVHIWFTRPGHPDVWDHGEFSW